MNQQRFILLLIAVVFLFLDFCMAQDNASSSGEALSKFVATPYAAEGDLTPFAVELYHAAVKDNPDNALISSFGAAGMLGALYVGSAGQTEEELKAMLHWKSSKEDWVKYVKYVGGCLRETSDLHMQSAFWIQNNYMIKNYFIQTLQSCSFITVKNIDFTNPLSVQQVNLWIRMQSNGTIIPIYSTIPTNTKLVLMDFFTFDGAWKLPFPSDKTQTDAFTTIEGKNVQTKFMQQQNSFNYLKGPDFQYVELLCKNEIYSFNIIMPLDNEEFVQFEKRLTSDFIKKCQKESSLTVLDVALPTFVQNYNWNYRGVLKRLNVNTVFSRHSDLSNISSMNPLFVEKFSQMLHIDVNEQGPQMYANVNTNVNSMTFSKGSTVAELFNANRPFIYFIQERISGAILCMGRYVNPDKAEEIGLKQLIRKSSAQSKTAEE